MICFLLLVFISNTIYGGISSADENIYLKNGKVCYKCNPGTYWKADCEVSNSTAICSSCLTGTFQTKYNTARYCALCTVCERVVKNYWFARTVQTCTSVSDTTCGCVEGFHLQKVVGSADDWVCVENTECGPGFEVAIPATNNNDTVCHHCKNGFYKNSSSPELCRECSTCSNRTYASYPCNITHDTVCSTLQEKQIPLDIVLTIVFSVLGGIFIVTIALGVILCVMRRKREQRIDNTCKQSVLDSVEESTLYAKNIKRRDLETEVPDCIEGHIIEVNISEYYSIHHEQEINWTKLFQDYSNKAVIILHWERFIRTLCINTGTQHGVKADGIIAEVSRAHEQRFVCERIYNALKFWKERCYCVDDTYMHEIFMNSFTKHQQDLCVVSS